METIELTSQQEAELLEAPRKYLNKAPSDLLDAAIELQRVKSIWAQPVLDDLIQGWVEYEPIQVSEKRHYLPKVVCTINPGSDHFLNCQDESTFSVMSDRFDSPVIVRGEVSDEETALALDYMESFLNYSEGEGKSSVPAAIWYLSGHLDCCIRIHHWVDSLNTEAITLERSEL